MGFPDYSAPTFEQRVVGCLVGGACGDALGWPVEFMRWSEIAAVYGPSGISDLGQSRCADAFWGEQGLPPDWIEKVQMVDVFRTLARDYISVVSGSVDANELWDRYPGW